MARLAAQEKLLYYPTPNNQIDLILSNIKVRPGATIYDPCCGDGAAVHQLGSRLQCSRIYGTEVHKGRCRKAAKSINAYNGARELCQVSGKFDIVFDNPPYDVDVHGNRMETDHIIADLKVLGNGGLFIGVIPQSVLSDERLATELAKWLYRIKVRRFTSPEFEVFKQVVIIGIKNSVASNYYYSEQLNIQKYAESELPPLSEHEFSFEYRAWGEEIGITISEINPQEIEGLIEINGAHLGPGWEAVTGTDHQTESFRPLLQPQPGHMAILVSAGYTNGTEIESPTGDPILLKGSNYRYLKTTIENNPEEESSTKRDTEKIVYAMCALNMRTGEFEEYNTEETPSMFADFLTTHQSTLVDAVNRNYPPLFQDEWVANYSKLALVKAPGKLAGRESNGRLLPAQEHRAAAIAHRLKTSKAAIIVGEMGTGKTATSQAILALIGKGDNWKTVVACPSPIAEKWAREVGIVLANFGVKAHIIGEERKQSNGQGKVSKCSKPILDIQRAMDEPNPSILILSYETAKNGSRWEHAVEFHNRKVTYTRVERRLKPKTYSWQHDEEEEIEIQVTETKKVACCPNCGATVGGPMIHTSTKTLGDSQRRCNKCKSPLWQMVPFKYGGRIAAADFLNRHYSGKFNLVMDEAHHTKGGDTDAGYASADLIAAAQKVIIMTGTIYNGKASSLFHIFYRLIPSFRKTYNHDQVELFVAHHGLREWITKEKKESRRWSSSYGYDRSNERVKEMPGVTPGIISQLLPYTTFLKLSDLGIKLPDYAEERVAVPLDSRLEKGAQNLEKLRAEAIKLMREGTPGMLSQWLYAAMGWLDCPITDKLEAKNVYGDIKATYELKGLLDSPDEELFTPLAKDQVILDIVKSELSTGRGCGIYFSQVNRRDWMPRMHKLLEDNGVYSEILRQETAKPELRERWYRDFVERCRAKGQEPCLLANGNLVKEGLDLVELPTLIEAGIEYRITDLRQRDRRSWRLIQTRPVRVIFVYYENTFQQTALQLVAAKLKAAMMVDGNLASGLAAIMADSDDGSIMSQLMKSVAETYTGTDWAGMAQVKFEKVPFKPVLAAQQETEAEETPLLLPESAKPLVSATDLILPTFVAIRKEPRRNQGNVVITQYSMWG